MLKRHSFWVRVIQSIQIILGSVQGVALATEDDVQKWNIVIAFIQGGLGVISLWTADTNHNDIVDVAEKDTMTTVKVTSSGPADVDIQKEKILNSGHSFTEGGDPGK